VRPGTRPAPLVPDGHARGTRIRRHGVCAYLATWDVHQARIFGQVEDRIPIPAFDALVASVMERDPYLRSIRVTSKDELKDPILAQIAELNETPVVFRWTYGR
jgi:hypothetical protein